MRILGAVDAARGELTPADAALAATAAPHSPQKSSPGSFEAPHRGHWRASATPHFEQNFRPSRLSVPHFEQRMLAPATVAIRLIPPAAPWRLSGRRCRSPR